MKKTLRVFTLIVFLCLSSGFILAQDMVAIQGSMATTKNIVLINSADGTASSTVQVQGGQALTAIARDPSTNIYYASAGGGGGVDDRIFTLDLSTGVLTPLGTGTGSTGTNLSFSGLEFVGGKLYACTGLKTTIPGRNLYTIDLATAVATLVGSNSYKIVSLASDGTTLYGVDHSDVGINPFGFYLVTISTTDASVTEIGEINPALIFSPSGQPASLTYTGGKLYTCVGSGDFYSIDPATATLTLIADTGYTYVSGLCAYAARVPVSNWAIFILVLAISATVVYAFRRKLSIK